MFGDGREGLSDPAKATKATTEWKAEFTRHLNRIENLKQGGSEGDVLWIRARLLGDAIAVTPSGPLREMAMSRYLSLMSAANIPADDVAQWYYSVTSWIGLCETFGVPRQDTLAKLEQSGHPWLQLVSRIEGLRSGHAATPQHRDGEDR
jgi:hypothetical protein